MKKLLFSFLIIFQFIFFYSFIFSNEAIFNKDTIFFPIAYLHKQQSIILIIDPDTGSILESSQGAKKYYGYPQLDSMNISGINTLTPYEIKQEMDKAANENKNYFHFKHKLFNGYIRDVYVNSYPMQYNDKSILLSTIKDATEELKTERSSNFFKLSTIIFLFFSTLATTFFLIKIYKSEKRFQALFENMLEAFALHEMIFDDNGNPIDYRFISVNPYFEKLTGLKKENIIGKTVKEIMPNTEKYWIDAYGKVTKTKEPLFYENYSKELNKYFSCYAFSPYKNRFAVVFSDVTKQEQLKQALKEEKEKAEEMAVHDYLTKLPNRRLLQDRIENSILLAKRNKSKIAVCMLDLDNFKNINDKYGHPVGDEVLKTIARRSKKSLREYDTISRVGGDEFVVLITNFTTKEDCEQIVERILNSNKKEMKIKEFILTPSFSIGVALFPEDGIDYEELIRNADKALYDSKRRGKKCFTFYKHSL